MDVQPVGPSKKLRPAMCSRSASAKSLSRVRLSVTPWTVAHEAPPSMGLSGRNTEWLPRPARGDLPDPKIQPQPPAATALRADSFLPGRRGSPHFRGEWD